jgi:threonyl-tRNA synthetase
VADEHSAYAEKVAADLRAGGFRVEVTGAEDKLGARIRRGKQEKVPYVLVVGGDDVEAGTVGVNDRSGAVDRGVAVGDFAERLRREVEERRVPAA